MVATNVWIGLLRDKDVIERGWYRVREQVTLLQGIRGEITAGGVKPLF